jgi:transposase
MAQLFWLSDRAWALIEPHLLRGKAGKPRVDGRRVISHILKTGGRWRDVPEAYGPPTTIYNRVNRWSRRGIWQRMFEKVATSGKVPAELMLDTTHVKAHRSASGAKGGEWDQAVGVSRGGRATKVHAAAGAKGRPTAFAVTPGQTGDMRFAQALIEPLPPALFLAADMAYDGEGLRAFLAKRRTIPVIPNNPTRKRLHPLQRTRLHTAQQGRAQVMPSQRLPARRNPLRQARRKLRRNGLHRSNHNLVDLTKPRA